MRPELYSGITASGRSRYVLPQPGFGVVDILGDLPRFVRFLAKDGDKPARLRDRLLAAGSVAVSTLVPRGCNPDRHPWRLVPDDLNSSDRFG